MFGTYNVHDSEDIAFHFFASMIVHHFRVSHHQSFHPLLSAHRAFMNPFGSTMASVLPSLSPTLNALKSVLRI